MVATRRFLSVLLLAGCGASNVQHPEPLAPAPEDTTLPPLTEPPLGMLPENVEPTSYEVALTVDPRREQFEGDATIRVRVQADTQQIWLHGNELEVEAVEVTDAEGQAVEASYAQHDDQGLAELRLSGVLRAGEATLHFRYRAPYNRALRGLYRVDEADESYAFTQFEATSARLAFPSFDEPRFKTPFTFTLTVPESHRAFFNTPSVDSADAGDGMKRVRFAPTRPLPTYLIAMAVGPFDVVEHAAIEPNDVRSRPLPFRGIATAGKGEQLAFAMEHTGAIVAALERYFGIPYPYEKLDIVAVPDFAAGAMENAGLITFRDPLLLLGEAPPENQVRAYSYVMAHELAHQWFGNLVTLAWWDDIWLNEAFATWMGYKATAEVFPEQHADLAFLQRVHGAMHSDSLVSARQIRQPIESNHDIRNAFDSITYRKGGGVLTMFERWLSEDTFRTGIRNYMRAHADGVATYRELLSALDEASGRDVTTAFSTFLFQPGLPLVAASVECEGDAPRVALNQSRYLPVGSTGRASGGESAERGWQIPVCVRAGMNGESRVMCNLLDEAAGAVPVESCPDWVMPNADGAGYYRFSMGSDAFRALGDSLDELNDREKLAYVDALDGAVRAATVSYADALRAYEGLVNQPLRPAASAPMGFYRFTADRLVPDARAAVRRRAWQRYRTLSRRLGWQARDGEDGEQALLRSAVMDFGALFVRDRATRRAAVQRAERYLGMGRGGSGELDASAVDPNLIGTVLAVAVQEKDAAFFDALVARFRASSDAIFRSRILAALAQSDDAELRDRARELALDPGVRVNEMLVPFYVQMADAEHQLEAWEFVETRFDDLAARLETGTARLVGLGGRYCSTEGASRIEAFFAGRIESIPGGPRSLATALESVRLCAARADAHREGADAVF
ncbi:MAG: M1 family metallopeptidase [Myxococcota bacterium]